MHYDSNNTMLFPVNCDQYSSILPATTQVGLVFVGRLANAFTKLTTCSYKVDETQLGSIKY